MSEEQYYFDVTKGRLDPNSPDPRHQGVIRTLGPSSGTYRPRTPAEYEKAVANAEKSARDEYEFRQGSGQPATMDRIYCELIADAEQRQAMILESLRLKEEALDKAHASKIQIVTSLMQLRDSPTLKEQPVLQAVIISILGMSK